MQATTTRENCAALEVQWRGNVEGGQMDWTGGRDRDGWNWGVGKPSISGRNRAMPSRDVTAPTQTRPRGPCDTGKWRLAEIRPPVARRMSSHRSWKSKWSSVRAVLQRAGSCTRHLYSRQGNVGFVQPLQEGRFLQPPRGGGGAVPRTWQPVHACGEELQQATELEARRTPCFSLQVPPMCVQPKLGY